MNNDFLKVVELINANKESDLLSKEWAVCRKLGYFDPFQMFCNVLKHECTQKEIETIEQTYFK